MRYGALTDGLHGRHDVKPGKRKGLVWNPRKAVGNLAVAVTTGAVVAVLTWMGVMWLAG